VHRRLAALGAIVLVLALAAGLGGPLVLSRVAAFQQSLAARVGTVPPTATPSPSPGDWPSPDPSPPIAGATPNPVAIGTTWLAAHSQPDLPIKAQAAVLFDVGDHQALWVRDPNGRRAPASLTKLVTAMVVADHLPLDRNVPVTAATDSAAAQQVEPAATIMGITAGETLTVRELLYGLFLRSGNDAAETLAAALGREPFLGLMNAKAGELAMSGSHFTTPVGLDEPDHYTTAWDLGLAAAAIASRYPTLLAISGTPSVHLDQTPTHKPYDLVNYNKLVRADTPEFYQGATGMKTAYTENAGSCLVVTARRGDRTLVAVMLHSDDFFADAHALLDYGFGVGPVS
jgi:serine-type D-Ala-D-Ala carboxypeptidase (penicillin-binding protein 5/6)